MSTHATRSNKVHTDRKCRATLTGGSLGGLIGTAAGALGVYGASQRYPAFRNLTLPFRAFLIVSTGTFAGTSYTGCPANVYKILLTLPTKPSLPPILTHDDTKGRNTPRNATAMSNRRFRTNFKRRNQRSRSSPTGPLRTATASSSAPGSPPWPPHLAS